MSLLRGDAAPALPAGEPATPSTGARSSSEPKTSSRARGAPPLVIVVDHREQLPYSWPGIDTIGACLPTGDYTFAGSRGRVAVERKSAADFAGSVTRERKRFWAELERLAALDFGAVVVESSPDRLAADLQHTAVNIRSVVASALAITTDFDLPVVWAGSRAGGAWATEWMLRRLYERALAGGSP